MWDVATRRALGRPLEGHDAILSSVAFNPNGSTLATGDISGWSSVLWSDDRTTLNERLCTSVRRALTRAEWDEFLPEEPYLETRPYA